MKFTEYEASGYPLSVSPSDTLADGQSKADCLFLSDSLDFNDSAPYGDGDSVCSIVCAEFGENASHMGLHGLF